MFEDQVIAVTEIDVEPIFAMLLDVDLRELQLAEAVEIDEIMVLAGGVEIGDRVAPVALGEHEVVSATLAGQFVIALAAGDYIGAVIAADLIVARIAVGIDIGLTQQQYVFNIGEF